MRLAMTFIFLIFNHVNSLSSARSDLADPLSPPAPDAAPPDYVYLPPIAMNKQSKAVQSRPKQSPRRIGTIIYNAVSLFVKLKN